MAAGGLAQGYSCRRVTYPCQRWGKAQDLLNFRQGWQLITEPTRSHLGKGRWERGQDRSSSSCPRLTNSLGFDSALSCPTPAVKEGLALSSQLQTHLLPSDPLLIKAVPTPIPCSCPLTVDLGSVSLASSESWALLAGKGWGYHPSTMCWVLHINISFLSP